MAKKDSRFYAAKFKNIVKNKIPVTGCKYDTEISEVILNAAEYKQCYKRGDRIREELPRYWFISKEGFLISLYYKQPKWVAPNIAADRPEFIISRKGTTKSIATYTLVGLVWGSRRTVHAQQVMNAKGLDSLGRLEVLQNQRHVAKVQGHHSKIDYLPEKTIENYISNNDPSNIDLVTVREHDVLNKIKRGETDSMIFYQPKFIDVPHDEIQVYDITNARILNPSEVVLEKIIRVGIMPREEDSLITEKFIFLLEDGRTLLEENKFPLEMAATSLFSRIQDDVWHPLHFIIDYVEYVIMVRKNK